MEEDFLCIVPARGGSKGLPRKNVRTLAGKPLIAWTIEEAKKSSFLGKIYVSTEDAEIAKVSLEYGAHMLNRPEELAQDHTSSVDVVIHALNEIDYSPKHIVLLQCTSPLRSVEHIDQALSYYLEHLSEFDSLISVVELKDHPFLSRTMDDQGILKNFIPYDSKLYHRRQTFPKVYRPNGALYIISKQAFLEFKSFQTTRTYGYVMDVNSSIDIDEEFDLKLAEYYLKMK